MLASRCHGRLLAATLAASLLLVSCTPGDRTPRIVDGYLTPTQADRIIEQWPDSVRDQLVRYVYSVELNRYLRACGEDPMRRLPAARLSGDGFRLPAHHGDDLSCALVEANVYLLAERGPRAAGFTTLVAVVASEHVVEIEVELSADGVVRQVYGLHAPALGHRLVLRPRPAEAPIDDALVIERRVTEQESLNAMRALLGRGAFDLSAVGVGGVGGSPPGAQAVALGDGQETDRP
ncbi:MAG: hypothetical protein AAF184_10195 [Pseudomonadota bacterium]